MWSAIRNLPRDVQVTTAVYAVVCLVMWPIPVLQVLHVESSAVIALVAFFVAGLTGIGAFERANKPTSVLGRQVLALQVSLVLLTVSALWAPNCGYLQGLMFFLLFPVITVILAVAVAYLVTASGLRFKRVLLTAIGMITVLGGPLIDYLFHPQLYTYNHVFGGLLGPIYDEELAIRPGMFMFRALTLCWAALAIFLGLYLQNRVSAIYAGGCTVLIALAYIWAPQLGFVTTEMQIRNALGEAYEVPRFTVYYDPEAVDDRRLQEMADELSYRYEWLVDRLEMDPYSERDVERPPEHISVYIYPDPDTKANLTGARYTSVAPLWLANPQVHVLKDRFASSAAHELAHIFTRSFAATRLNISPIAGLIEAAAVALEPSRGLPTPAEQVITNALQRGYEPGELASDMTRRLSPLGFWTGRGAVSYTTVGSFASFLIDSYGAGRFREVYRSGRFMRVYGKSLEALSAEWERSLQLLPAVSAGTAEYVTPRFAAPSLFERYCPHFVPRHVRMHRQASTAYEAADTSRARENWNEALYLRPGYSPALIGLARLSREEGDGRSMASFLDNVSEQNPTRWFLLGDAAFLRGDVAQAKEYYREARRRTPVYQHEGAAVISMREALLQSPTILSTWITSRDEVSAGSEIEGVASNAAENLLAGYLYLQSGEGERALDIWRTYIDRVPLQTNFHGDKQLVNQWHRWMADAHYNAGHFTEARHWYLAAADEFHKMGHLPAYHHMNDAAEKMHFLSSR